MRILPRRRSALILAAVIALAGAGAAIAYWTTGGSGTGSAPVGSTQNVVVKQTSTLTATYPGAAAQTLSGNFDNPNDGPVYVNTVTASIASVTLAANPPAGTCAAVDFTLTDPVVSVAAEVPAGTAKGSWTGPKLTFNNRAVNQDACKGATVNLAYAVG